MWSRRGSALVIAALLIAAVVLAACSVVSAPQGEPSIRGVVTAIAQNESGTGGSFRVVWTDDPSVGAKAEFDAAQVGWNEDTAFYRRPSEEGAELEEITASQIKTGSVVEAWFEGAVAESYPVQASASAVVVTGAYDGELPTPPGLEPEPAP